MTTLAPANGRDGETMEAAPLTATEYTSTTTLPEAIRPTLFIFLGGTGVRIATFLKALLIARFGYPLPPWIRLLVFDTTREPFAVRRGDRTIQLEEGSELFVLSDVPVGRVINNIDNLPGIRERLGSVIANLPARVMRDGTKSNRCLGALALLWHFRPVWEELRKAVWRLAGRDVFGTADPLLGLNVVIGAGLGGGTGSGTFLDVAYMLRALCDDLGIQSEFCRFTGYGVLPQAYPGIPSHSLNPNTGAALKELDHAMVRGNFKSRYPNGRTVHLRESPFNQFFTLDGVNERGQTWAGLDDVAEAGAQAIFLQMTSALGRSGDNTFDNLDEALAGQTEGGHGTFLSSVGEAYLEFAAPDVAALCGRRLVRDVIRAVWLPAGPVVRAASEAEARRQSLRSDWLVPRLLRDPQTGGELHVDLRPPAWLLDKRHDEVAAAAANYLRQYGHGRVGEMLLAQTAANGETLARELCADWEAWTDAALFAPDRGAGDALAVLDATRAGLATQADGGRRRLGDLEQRIERATTAVGQTQTALERAADSLPFGRAGRVRAELERLFKAGQALFEAQLAHGLLRSQLAIWSEVDAELERLARLVSGLADRLAIIARRFDAVVADGMGRLAAGGVARLSLADEAYVESLYRRHAPDHLALLTLSAFHGDGAARPLDLAALDSAELGERLASAVAELFAPVSRLTVEQVIEERAAEMTPRARRRQLFQLATPSWSIDRTRLPEGGDDLVRLEILGVPNARQTCFTEEPLLVSTNDPHRIVALVIAAGAPVSALQQYDRYQAALERAKASRPMHVLPALVADANRGRLAFALGGIFGLIRHEGRYFYYQPADALSTPLLVGQGLANAVNALAGREPLTNEIMERVDAHIARIGLREAIARLTDYYRTPTNGRSALDEVTRELKRLVRDYTEELIEINAFDDGRGDFHRPADGE
jgi:hypothetical protein